MKSAEIRDAFLKFFERKGHAIVPSSSLVPIDDPTLLFTNAGMVQFKDVFLGLESRSYARAASAQRCVRAGGKHNDLENVGYTARHHTFFEMLGNFSFGDYFKREAIGFAWEFLTQVLRLPPERLWVTVHESDDEAANIWLNEVGVNPQRFSRLDEDNFWQMGDTGPCGPCSEIFYDHGEEVPGGPPGSENDNLDRYIEIWNLVFMQYERQSDDTLVPLPKPSVDTGMGLERIAAVMQGVHSNYEIDLFVNLVKAVAEITGTGDMENKSLRVIADHIRSCAFLVADRVIPARDGRGYVLRRIIRRAVRHGYKLGCEEPFFYKLVAPLAVEMGDAYPELVERQDLIERVLLAEEKQFKKTLKDGMAVLEKSIQNLQGSVISGDVVFKLHDTYGFPQDLTNDVARERGLSIDLERFNQLMRGQQTGGGKSPFTRDYTASLKLEGKTDFLGYDRLTESGTVEMLFKDGEPVDVLAEGEEGVIVLDRTPFYAESGGQVGDTGYIRLGDAHFEVLDCSKEGDSHLHFGRVLSGSMHRHDVVTAEVDGSVRQATALNHSATHLLHAALRKVLGEHITQKGSLVDSQRLRFDFSHFEAVKPEELKIIEQMVNSQIRANSKVQTEICDMEAAKAKGAMALFGEKYGDEVRVLSMGGSFSIELCGGTHVERTGDIGLMRIVSESGVAAGVRRIEAVTGAKALALFDHTQHLLEEAARLVKASPENLPEKLRQIMVQSRQMEKEIATLKAKLASAASGDLLSQAQDVEGIKVLAVNLESGDAKSLRDTADQLKNKLGTAVVLLAVVEGDKVSLVASVTQNVTSRIKAGDLMRHVAPQLGGKGGGRPDMAQGGGSNPGALPMVLAAVPGWVKGQLSALA